MCNYTILLALLNQNQIFVTDNFRQLVSLLATLTTCILFFSLITITKKVSRQLTNPLTTCLWRKYPLLYRISGIKWSVMVERKVLQKTGERDKTYLWSCNEGDDKLVVLDDVLNPAKSFFQTSSSSAAVVNGPSFADISPDFFIAALILEEENSKWRRI